MHSVAPLLLCSRHYSCCFISLTATHTALFPTERVRNHKISASAGTILVIVLREINVSTTTATIMHARYLLTAEVCVALRDYAIPRLSTFQVEIAFNVKSESYFLVKNSSSGDHRAIMLPCRPETLWRMFCIAMKNRKVQTLVFNSL